MLTSTHLSTPNSAPGARAQNRLDPMSARRRRTLELRYDDGFRAGITTLITLPAAVVALCIFAAGADASHQILPLAFVTLCGVSSGFSVLYLVWTHRVFSRLDDAECARIAAIQFRRGPSRTARVLGFARTVDWAVFAASISLFAAIAATIIGSEFETRDSLWLPALVLLTAGSAWATMVYAFALRYMRLHAGGETIAFDIEERPKFIDFVSMAVMVSSVGALSAGTPRTRAGLGTVRTHTFIAFGFNTLVIAMIVSLVNGFLLSA